VPAMMRTQHAEASASAHTSSSSTSACERQAARAVHWVREMSCMPAALFPCARL
jgi:hypothetical protein